jgi:mannose-6-phosphate isomerase-like protein (cupin superfamily)
MLFMPKSYEFNESSKDKTEVFQQAAAILLSNGFKLIDFDVRKPWGFYLSVDETQAEDFINQFYGDVELDGIDASLALRPKFLGVEPGKRLSWQYHHRRAEIWRPIAGSFNIVLSETDEETKPKLVKPGEVIKIGQGTRHRGVGLENWALIAEIWRHTDPNDPSNEDDIVRVQDDFGR